MKLKPLAATPFACWFVEQVGLRGVVSRGRLLGTLRGVGHPVLFGPRSLHVRRGWYASSLVPPRLKHASHSC